MAPCPSCLRGKRLHSTRDEALEHVKRLLWRNNVEGRQERSRGLGVYPCEQATGWHVGHAQGAPPVYHYTFGYHLDAIMQSGKLKVPRETQRKRRVGGKASRKWEPEPLLWFSRNPEWEYSVFKANRQQWGERHKWRTVNECVGQGLIRFAISAVYAKLRWSDYLARNPMSTAERDVMACYGNPVEWLATDEDVPLDVCSRQGDGGFQVFYRGQWINGVDTPEEFDAYIEARPFAYARAEKSLMSKVLNPQDPNAVEVMLTVDEWLVAEDIDHEIQRNEGVQKIRDRWLKGLKKAQNS